MTKEGTLGETHKFVELYVINKKEAEYKCDYCKEYGEDRLK